MAQIGNLGKQIVFEVSDQKILNFNSFSQKVSGTWSSHKTIGGKPRKEFNGPDSRRITLSIDLDASFGVKPREIIDRIEKMVEEGTAEYLVIGGRMVGDCMFTITEISEDWKVIYAKGELAKASAKLTLEEYR